LLPARRPTLRECTACEEAGSVKGKLRQQDRLRVQAPYSERAADAAYTFAHTGGRHTGQPVHDVKNAFHTALETAGITNFTWHDLLHTFAFWLMMKGASLRAVAELLGHRGLRMVMRYAHLSPAYLSSEVGLLDPPPVRSDKRARNGQRVVAREERAAKVGDFPKESGSSGRTRTYNPPVNSLVQVFYLVDLRGCCSGAILHLPGVRETIVH
jgi:hypothetical protein